MLGQRRKAIILFSLFMALVIGFWPLRLLSTYAGLCILYLAWIGLYFYGACSALLAPSPVTHERASRWWLVLMLPATFVTMAVLGREITLASGFRSFTVPSTSMETTIRRGDSFIADGRYYKARTPAHGDIVVFDRDGTLVVKRVVAVGGDTVEERNGRIILNGGAIDEPYAMHVNPDQLGSEDWQRNYGPVQIPAEKYFALGDNRDLSLDSRSPEVGFFDKASVVGKALYVFNTDHLGRHLR